MGRCLNCKQDLFFKEIQVGVFGHGGHSQLGRRQLIIAFGVFPLSGNWADGDDENEYGKVPAILPPSKIPLRTSALTA